MREELGVGVLSVSPFPALHDEKSQWTKILLRPERCLPRCGRLCGTLSMRCARGSRGWTGQTCPAPPGNSQPERGDRPRHR